MVTRRLWGQCRSQVGTQMFNNGCFHFEYSREETLHSFLSISRTHVLNNHWNQMVSTPVCVFMVTLEETVVGDYSVCVCKMNEKWTPLNSLLCPGQYFASIMIIVGMSVIATVVVLQYHHHDPNGGNMPKWVRLISSVQSFPYIVLYSLWYLCLFPIWYIYIFYCINFFFLLIFQH